MNVSSDVLAILEESTTDGPRLKLPDRQLDRSTYVAVDKALQAAGGKWNRSARAHVFDCDAAEAIDAILTTGQITTHREMGYFPTPHAIVCQMLDIAQVSRDDIALEPSAGQGAIAELLAEAARAVDCVELDERRADVIRAAGYARTVTTADFLTLDPAPVYDLVVMNPPFARQQDIAHVRHALEFLAPSGLLVSVMAGGATNRINRTAADFRQLVNRHGGHFTALPDESFRESGTGVHTVLVTIPAKEG